MQHGWRAEETLPVNLGDRNIELLGRQPAIPVLVQNRKGVARLLQRQQLLKVLRDNVAARAVGLHVPVDVEGRALGLLLDRLPKTLLGPAQSNARACVGLFRR